MNDLISQSSGIVKCRISKVGNLISYSAQGQRLFIFMRENSNPLVLPLGSPGGGQWGYILTGALSQTYLPAKALLNLHRQVRSSLVHRRSCEAAILNRMWIYSSCMRSRERAESGRIMGTAQVDQSGQRLCVTSSSDDILYVTYYYDVLMMEINFINV